MTQLSLSFLEANKENSFTVDEICNNISHHNKNILSGTLTTLFQKNRVNRIENCGKFKYYYKKFDNINRKKNKNIKKNKKTICNSIMIQINVPIETLQPNDIIINSRIKNGERGQGHEKLKNQNLKKGGNKNICSKCKIDNNITFCHPDKKYLSHKLLCKMAIYACIIEETYIEKFNNKYEISFEQITKNYVAFGKDECLFLCKKCDKNF